MDIIRKIMSNLSFQKEKLKVSADNLARSVIPGAREKEVTPTFSPIGGPQQTHAKHLRGTGDSSPFQVKTERKSQEASLDGNSIDAEKQLTQASDAATHIHLNVSLITKIMDQQSKILNK